jgi:ABC-type nickel/cobalt efflux system permease component RcnA
MPLKRLAGLAACAFALMLLSAGVAEAADGATIPATSSAFGNLMGWIFVQQRAFHRELTQALRLLSDGASPRAGLWLIFASFVYGVFHAAGPGHGKAVLSAYLLTQKTRLRRGVALGVAASFCQGLSAIVIVYGLIWLAGWRASDTAVAVSWSERVSYLLLAGMGAFLALRAVRGFVAELRGSHTHDHDHHQHHDHGCGCGCAHAPSAPEIAKATDLKTAVGLVLSIGLRPCSGAVLVLIFAYAAKIAWAGMLAVVAMSAGTALAVALLALFAVKARDWAGTLAAGHRRGATLAASLVGFCGGALVALLGVSLMLYSFGPQHPLGIS